MKRLYLSVFLTVLLGLYVSTLDILAQTCTQLSLPDNAIARLCKDDGRSPRDLDYAPDGKTLAALYSAHVVLWDIENKTQKLTIYDINGRTVRYSPDGKTFVSGDVVYDATTGEPQLLLLDGEGYRDYVDYSPNGKIIAGAGSKGIRFWNATTQPTTDSVPVDDTPIDVLPTDTPAVNTPIESPTSIPIATSATTVPYINGLSFSPDGKELAIPCGLGIWIYDTENRNEVALLTKQDRGHESGVFSIGYSPDGSTFASGAVGEIRLWDAVTKNISLQLLTSKYLVSV